MNLREEEPTITVTLTHDEAMAITLLAHMGSLTEDAKTFYPRNTKVSKAACQRILDALDGAEDYVLTLTAVCGEPDR